MSAYLIGNFRVTNPEGFTEYRSLVCKTIVDRGGECIVADVNSSPVESDPENFSVVLKFPDMEALRDWYDSPEYQDILPLRTDNSEGIITFASLSFHSEWSFLGALSN